MELQKDCHCEKDKISIFKVTTTRDFRNSSPYAGQLQKQDYYLCSDCALKLGEVFTKTFKIEVK
jgi:hypothetical protein